GGRFVVGRGGGVHACGGVVRLGGEHAVAGFAVAHAGGEAVAFGQGQAHGNGHHAGAGDVELQQGDAVVVVQIVLRQRAVAERGGDGGDQGDRDRAQGNTEDRKSTRLNS